MVVSFLRNDEELGMTKENRSVVRRALGAGASALLVCSIATAPAGAATPTPDPIFTPVKVFPSNWSTKPGHAQMYGWGAATMLDGSILIGDYWNYRIQRITLNPDGSVNTVQPNFIGNQGFKPGQNQAPYGIAVDPTDGNIFVADTDRYKIDVYDPSGTFIMEYGTQGSGVNQFLYPSRIAIRSDGTVYVADTWSNQIVAENVNTSTKTVTELGTVGSFGTGDGCKMKQPHGMAWYYGADGTASITDDRLYVVDTNNKQIDVYGSNPMAGGCGWLFSFGSAGSDPSQFKGDLRGIAIDQHDTLSPTGASVYVVDGEGNKVRKFATDGTWMRNYGAAATDPNAPGPGEFSDGGREVTVDQFHHVWVGDMPGFRAQVFDGTQVGPGVGQLFSVPTTYSPPSVLGFNGPRGVAVDAAGDYFVTDTYNQRIIKYDKDGNYLTSWGSRGRDDYAFNYTRMIAIDPTDQSVVVADTDNHRFKKFTNDGTFVCQAGGLGSVGPLMRNPHGIDVGADGTIFVTDTRNGLIKAFDPQCNFLFASTYAKGSAGGSLTYPRGIAVDPSDGSVWVADSTLDIVKHYAVDPGSATPFAYLGSVGSKGTADNQWSGPFDVEVDASGRMFVADTKSNKIKVWDVSHATPTFLEAYGGGGTKLGKFMQPQGLDLSPYDGTLWVCEQKNERVQQLTLAP
jgi:tripartite motif-containing protein 71